MQRLTRAFIAAAGLALLGVGLPVFLVTLLGWPFPERMPTDDEWKTWLEHPLTRDFLTGVFAVPLWGLWGLFLFAVLLDLLNRLTGLRLGRLRRLVSPIRALTTGLVGGVVTAPFTAPPVPAVHVASLAPQAVASDPAIEGIPPPATATVSADNAAALVYQGRAGDWVWYVAERFLGDPRRYPDIAELNPELASRYGDAFPDHFEPGDSLRLPADAYDRGPRRHATGTVHSVAPSPSNHSPDTDTPPGSSGHDETAPNPPTPAQPVPPPTAAPTGPGPTASTGSSVTAPAHSAGTTTAETPNTPDPGHGATLPSRGWVSLGLAATIAAAATLLRLQHRRRAKLAFPIPVRTGATPAPVPDSLRPADAAGSRILTTRAGGPLPGLMPETPRVPAPIGVNEHGDAISLFAVPGPALALYGNGAPPAARGVIAAVLATAVTDHVPARPVLVTSADTVTQLLPDGAAPDGLDPRHETFDGERLIVVADIGAAVTHLETEMIHRRRLLDHMGVDSVAELNRRTDHAEQLAPYVLLVPAEPRYTARILAVAAHRHALHLHPIILGTLDNVPEVTRLHVAENGTFTTTTSDDPVDPPLPRAGRLAALSARDLADVLGILAAVAARPELGAEPAAPPSEEAPDASSRLVDLTEVPAPADAASPPPVRLTVLGPPALATADGPITTGVRRGSLAVLAVLAAYPKGRTFEQLAADLHPDTDRETGTNRVRTDLNAVRSLLRQATGIGGRGKFIVYDNASGRYRIDPQLIEVDLWQMLSAIARANNAGDDDTACLAALREAVAHYAGEFADGQDRAWTVDYATTYRHQLLNAHARIAEILEADRPDEAIAALEAAIAHDPVNEELYQRLMRIQGRLGRPDAVRRTLRLLEDRLAELGDAEPSEATRRVAVRQLKPTLTSHE